MIFKVVVPMLLVNTILLRMHGIIIQIFLNLPHTMYVCLQMMKGKVLSQYKSVQLVVCYSFIVDKCQISKCNMFAADTYL